MAVGGAVVAASPGPSFRPHAMVQLVARPTIRIMRGNVVFISRPHFGHSPRTLSRVSREHAVDVWTVSSLVDRQLILPGQQTGGTVMGSTRRRFTDEYKQHAVRLVVDSGDAVAEIARSIGVHEMTLRKWVKKARDGDGEESARPLDEGERAEL